MDNQGNDGTVDWDQPADLTLRTVDHPEANGRKAEAGDTEWKVRLPLEDGRILDLELGDRSLENLEHIVLQIRTNRALAEIGVFSI